MKIVDFKDFRENKLPDEVIIKRVLEGEKELYELLMRRNNQKLYRVVKGYISDSGLIEDVMQNTYLKAYEKLSQFKFNAQFSTWLIRIGINESLIELKHKGKYLSFHEENNAPLKKRLKQQESVLLNPEKKMIQQEARIVMEEAISRLKPKYRIVYILKEVEGLSIAEIAACLNISTANVKVRLHRSKKRLRDVMYSMSVSNEIFEFGNYKCDALVEKVMELI